MKTPAATCLLTLFFAAAAFSQNFMMSESLGPIKIGQPASQARAMMHSKPKEGAILLSEADGRFNQIVDYPKEGISFTFASDSKNGPQEVYAVKIKKPCKFRTKTGVHIGSTRAEVLAAYRDKVDADLNTDESLFVAGSTGGGISVSFKDGKAVQIYLGPIEE